MYMEKVIATFTVEDIDTSEPAVEVDIDNDVQVNLIPDEGDVEVIEVAEVANEIA